MEVGIKYDFGAHFSKILKFSRRLQTTFEKIQTKNLRENFKYNKIWTSLLRVLNTIDFKCYIQGA